MTAPGLIATWTLQGQPVSEMAFAFITCLLEWQLQPNTLTPGLVIYVLSFLSEWAQIMGELRLSLLSAKSGIGTLFYPTGLLMIKPDPTHVKTIEQCLESILALPNG